MKKSNACEYKMATFTAKAFKKTAYLACRTASFLGMHQPKEPDVLNRKK